jgi:hypothetical protein
MLIAIHQLLRAIGAGVLWFVSSKALFLLAAG